MEGQSRYDELLEAQAPIRELSEKLEAEQERVVRDFLRTHPEYDGGSRDILRAFYQELVKGKELAENDARKNTRKFLGVDGKGEGG